jgi:hypothetical protein
MSDLLLGLNEADLLDQLSGSVSSTIKKLEEANLDWDSVGMLLASSPIIGVALKGGTDQPRDLWGSVKTELRSFLCTDSEKYADLRKQFEGIEKKSSHIVVASLAASMADYIPVAAGIIAPMVIWGLVTAMRISKEAFCECTAAQLNAPAPPSPPAPANPG